MTSQDLTPYIKRGDRISALGWEYAVHAFRPFNSTHLYLAKVTSCLIPRSAKMTMCMCIYLYSRCTFAVVGESGDILVAFSELKRKLNQVTVFREPNKVLKSQS